MKLKELRIGNYIIESVLGEVEIASILKNEKVEVLCKNLNSKKEESLVSYIINIDSIKPMLLTEERLLKLGAKKFQKTIYIPIPSLKAELHFEIYNDEIVTIFKSDFANIIFNRIMYVHQLQNLFFDLSNSELFNHKNLQPIIK